MNEMWANDLPLFVQPSYDDCRRAYVLRDATAVATESYTLTVVVDVSPPLRRGAQCFLEDSAYHQT